MYRIAPTFQTSVSSASNTAASGLVPQLSKRGANVGAMRYMAEQGKDFDPAIWNAWEKSGAGKALAMPGAIEALKIMRDAGVTIIANTNRTSANAKGTEDTLRAAGLGEFKHGETLFLMGDDATGSSKDARRSTIAARYCVVALAGDQLGDFANAFNAW